MDGYGRNNETWLLQLRGSGAEQQAALAELRAALLRGLRRVLSSRPVADESFLEDAVQDSLVRILERLEQFEGRSRFLTWATSIAIRIAMSELRRRRWKDVSFEELTAGGGISIGRATEGDLGSDVQCEQRAILDKMRAVIETELTEKQRAALLAELRGMPQDEIALHLGSNRNAVYKLTHDARKRLRRGLEAAGYGAAEVSAAFPT